ncbi:uncharacterized protein AB9X84_022883 isoform 1-T4 [Acanthopagrus schlegelii]
MASGQTSWSGESCAARRARGWKRPRSTMLTPSTLTGSSSHFQIQTAAHCRSSLIAWEVLSRSVAGLWHSRSWQSFVPVLPQCQPTLPCIHARGLITQKDPP